MGLFNWILKEKLTYLCSTLFIYFRYTCVGRNGFNKEGDREEGHVQVNFVKGKSKYSQKIEVLKI